MMVYGDYLQEIGYATRKIGLQWENLAEDACAPGDIELRRVRITNRARTRRTHSAAGTSDATACGSRQ